MADSTGIYSLVASSIEDLEPHLGAWDALAVATARPMMRPAWLLAWWRGLRESGVSTELRVAAVFDEAGLVGVFPMHVERTAASGEVHHMLGAGFWGLGPLLRMGAPANTIQHLAERIAAASPRPRLLSLEGVEVSSGWTEKLCSDWPKQGAHIHRVVEAECLGISIDGDFAAWLRGTWWRGKHGRMLRRFAERGVTLQRSDASTFRKDLAELVRLHQRRWNNRSEWLTPAVKFALETAGQDLCACGAVRLWSLQSAERLVGGSLFAAAGGGNCFLMTAYDPAWRSYSPGIATVIAGIEESFALGERCVDLGHGRFEYKRELANAAWPLAWVRVFPRGPGYHRMRARWAPRHARERGTRLRVELAVRHRLAAFPGRRGGRQAA
jgi:CelD/BcsL family acetyltransferase involved in cellulose biosynthesis